ncbi:hypothetical protein N7481_009437 [Penicillium waksmanii]|uniref:uncharacterized protein n=1 Tax=Penicillium waksmanii TaxID=69791 RepID=UPI00254893FB|nr:uncharacterized protein N7481_009437 [Penicillium waksmanii]KAJ5975730.1 hypothetical protein N7481_009437 [Penicillium waksmanii]
MGKTFEKIRLCSVGKLQDADKIPQWVRANGGDYTKSIDSRTTHLVTTKEAYKQNVEAVKEAKSLKNVKIVSFDWLEDSLLSKTRRPLKETPYLWTNLLSERKPNEANAQSAVVSKSSPKIWDPFLPTPKKSTKGAKGTSRGRVYQEPDNGDLWKATLVRPCNPLRQREKYQLAIMQSFAKQPSYSTYAKYSRVGTSKVQLLLPAQKNLSVAMKSFAEFFKDQTGKEWESRADKKMPLPKCNHAGEPLPAHEGWYSMEIYENIFTNYLKSYEDPSSTTDVEVQDKMDPVPEQPVTDSGDGSSKGLSQSHALLESLILMEFGPSTMNKPEEDNNTAEEPSEVVPDGVVEES